MPKPNKIVTYSIKLPQKVEQLCELIDSLYVRRAKFDIHVYLRVPKNILQIDSRLADTHFDGGLHVIEQANRYYAARTASMNPPIDIKAMADEVEQSIESKYPGADVYILCKEVVLVVNGTDYKFAWHAPSAGLILTTVDEQPFRQTSKKHRDELLEGDLSFAAPSRCEIKYVRKVVCDK